MVFMTFMENINIIVYVANNLNSLSYKISFYSLFKVWDVTISIFLYCVLINKLLYL